MFALQKSAELRFRRYSQDSKFVAARQKVAMSERFGVARDLRSYQNVAVSRKRRH